MKTLTACLLALACAAPATAAFAQNNVGDWVLAPRAGSTQMYPGSVQGRAPGRVTVLFDDGTSETLSIYETAAFDWRRGTRVECRWTDGQWYPGRITMMSPNGSTLDVAYDDGDRQRTNTARCRAPAA